MKKISLFFGLVFAVTCLMFTTSVLAAQRGTDVTKPRKGNVFVAVNGTFSTATKEEIVNRINAIRAEACKNGYINPSNGVTHLSMSDYVPVKWSQDLEWIAQTRAAEASVHQTHTRPNGTSCFDLKHNGVSANAECLAYNNEGMASALELWYTEKAAWASKADEKTAGHYAALINPELNYVALGTFTMVDDFDTTAAELASENNLKEGKIGVVGVYDQFIEVYKANAKIALSPTKVFVKYTAPMRLGATIVGTSISGGGKETKGYVPTDVTYSSNNAAAISVDSKTGLLKGLKAGSAVITAMYDGVSYSALATSAKFTIGKGKTPKLSNKTKKKLKITYKAVKNANGYQIQYALKKNFKGKKKKTTTAKTLSVKVKKGKRYYVRVRAYRVDPNGKKKYGKWSVKKSIVIKK